MLEQLPIFPVFKVADTDKIFTTLQEAAVFKGNLTLNMKYNLIFKNIPKNIKQKYNVIARDFGDNLVFNRDTLFNEIRAENLAIPSKCSSLLSRELENKEINQKHLAKILVEYMTSFIEEAWDSSKTHIMPHSSGYDSRLLSGILRKLVEKNGSDWLGELYFICWEPEVSLFKEIMNYQGWPEKYIITVEGNAFDFYSDAVEFQNVGKYCSDANRFICYCFDYLIYKEIEKLNISDDDVQLLSGLYSDEILRKNILWDDLSYMFVHYFHDVHFEWGMYNTILPFLSFDVVNLLLQHSLCKPDDLKLNMLKWLDPKLADFLNYRFEYFRIIKKEGSHPYYRLSKKTVDKLNDDFENSWYYKKRKINMQLPSILKNDDIVFREYSKAAVCDYLINKGVKINV